MPTHRCPRIGAHASVATHSDAWALVFRTTAFTTGDIVMTVFAQFSTVFNHIRPVLHIHEQFSPITRIEQADIIRRCRYHDNVEHDRAPSVETQHVGSTLRRPSARETWESKSRQDCEVLHELVWDRDRSKDNREASRYTVARLCTFRRPHASASCAPSWAGRHVSGVITGGNGPATAGGASGVALAGQ